MSHALHFLILMVAGWLQRRLQAQIEYLIAENAVYKQRLGRTGVRLTDAQRRQLAIKAKAVGRKNLARIATIASPDTTLRWYRRLVAAKYDSSLKRGPGRTRICIDLSALIARMAKENPRWGRRVEIAGIVHQPHDAWMKQIARNLTDAVDGFLLDKWKLIHDRDPLFSAGFRTMLGSEVTTIKLPAKSPNLNAYAERFVLSIKSECLNHVVPLGERHLRALVTEFVEHYHAERPHQGIANELIVSRDARANDNGPIVRRKRLGGMLSFYHRVAA